MRTIRIVTAVLTVVMAITIIAGFVAGDFATRAARSSIWPGAGSPSSTCTSGWSCSVVGWSFGSEA